MGEAPHTASLCSVDLLHVPPMIFLLLLDTSHCSRQVSIISNAEGYTLCNNSDKCAPFITKATTSEMIFEKKQLDLQGLFRVLSVRVQKHIVQRDQVNDACNVETGLGRGPKVKLVFSLKIKTNG